MSSGYIDIPVEGGGGGGSGTVTSVGLGLPASTFVISGSPVTTSGTLTGSFINQSANRFFAGPASGGAATPTWRALVSADLPAGTGTVTSVGLTAPSIFVSPVSGTPVTGSGTLALALATQSANLVWAGPGTGSAATPTFRSLVAADLPAGTGTVTSVALALPVSVFSISGSPVTSSGTLTGAFVTQSANTVFAGPTSGGASAPAFRALVPLDYPAFVGDSGSGGVRGAVPAPITGDATKFLKGSGVWASLPSATAAPIYEATVLANSPVGYWRLGDLAGSTAVDSSGNGYNGTYINTPALRIVGAIQVDPNTAVAFDSNTGEEMDVADNPVFDFDAVPFSGDAWIKYTLPVSEEGRYIISKIDIGGSAIGWGFLVGKPETSFVVPLNVIGLILINSPDYTYIYGSTNVQDGYWHHIAFTSDGTNTAAGINLYVDGILETMTTYNENPTPFSTSNTEDLIVSGHPVTTTTTTICAVDEAAVYSAVLGVTAISARVAAAGLHGPETLGTVAVWNSPVGVGNSVLYYDNVNERLGIDIPVPLYKLDVEGTIASYDGSTNRALYSSTGVVGNPSAYQFLYFDHATSHVGIGTTTAADVLSIAGSARLYLPNVFRVDGDGAGINFQNIFGLVGSADQYATGTLYSDQIIGNFNSGGGNYARIVFVQQNPGAPSAQIVAMFDQVYNFYTLGTTSINSATALTAVTDITTSTGNISSTIGSVAAATTVSAGTTVTAGTGVTSTTGDVVATIGNVIAGGGVYAIGTVRAGGSPAGGPGPEIFWDGTNSWLRSWNSSGGTYYPLFIDGQSIRLYNSGGAFANIPFLGTDVTGTIINATAGSAVLPIANGGTNSGATLTGNRMMVSATGGTAIVEAAAITGGYALISDNTTGLPIASSIAVESLNYLIEAAQTHTQTIVDGTGSPTTLVSWAIVGSTFSIFINYSIQKNTNEIRVGTMQLIGDFSGNVGINDNYIEPATPTGVVFSVSFGGGNLNLDYTATSTGVNGAFNYQLTKVLG